MAAPRTEDVLKFVLRGGHVDLQKQILGKTYHLSWPSWDALHRDLAALLELRKTGVALADFLAGLKKGDDEKVLMNLGERGAISFERFCLTEFKQFRSHMPSWPWESKRLDFILEQAKFNARELHTIRDFEIREWYNDYSRRPGVKSDNSRGHMLKVMRAVFRIATEQKYLREDPSRGIPLPAVPETRSRPLTFNETLRLYHAAEDGLRIWILIAYYTGLRQGEIGKLTTAQVDLSERKLTVFGSGTAKNRQRDFYIHDCLMPFMKEAAESVPNIPLLRAGGKAVGELPRSAFDRARKKANLPGVKFGFLRHTFASELLRTGTRDGETRSYLLGHKVRTMTGRYTHVPFELVQQAISRLPSLVAGLVMPVAADQGTGECPIGELIHG